MTKQLSIGPEARPEARGIRSAMRVLKAAADVQRARVLLLLGRRELCVCQIVEVLQLAPSTVSKHLSLLEAADWITHRKQGRWVYYRLNEEAAASLAPLLQWMCAGMQRDPVARADAKRLQDILRIDPEILCERQRPSARRAK